MSELKPCPFCGHRQEWKSRYTPEDAGYWSVQCPRCDAAGPLMHSESQAIAAWNRRADGWVSVEERLPEIGKRVLCLRKTGEQFVGVNELEGGEWWQASRSPWATRDVTHWRPLPNPPSESS